MGCFHGKSTDNIVYATLTQINAVAIFEQFFMSVVRKILSAMEITYQGFYRAAVLYRCIDMVGVSCFVFCATPANFVIPSVFGTHRADYRQIEHLSYRGKWATMEERSRPQQLQKPGIW